MKKLLSLLSLLTISGTAIPTTIAASFYQKEENANSNINNKTNNLETLNRSKRQNNKKNIIGISEIVIKTNSIVASSGVVLNDKVYFGSTDNNVYEYNPATNQQKVVIRTRGDVVSSGVVLNDKVYFGSYDNNVYEYDPATRRSKVVIMSHGYIESSGAVLNNKLYFGSYDHNLYEYDPATNISKTIFTTNNIFVSSGVVLNNKLYFGSYDHNVYEYDPGTNQHKIVIKTNGGIFSSGVVLNDKVYFGSLDHNVYEYDPGTNQQKVVIENNVVINSSGVVLNDKLYFGSHDNNVYEYNPGINQQQIAIITNGAINSSGVVLNDKLYFGSNDHNIYEYDPLELIESDIINMKEQIKRGLYLYYKEQNYNSKIKLISNINLNNLNISNDLNIESTQENKSSNLEENIGICLNVDATFINDSSVKQTQKTVSCSKQIKEIKTFQKMNGFTKSETTSNDKNWSTNINTSVTVTASGEAGIPLVTKGKVGVDVEVGGQYNFGGSRSYNLSDNSTSSDTEIKTIEDTVTIDIPSQSVVVPPNTTISINIISWQNNIELILSYYQKVKDMVSADFIDENNNKTTFSISIKDAMLKLSENDILPSKIIINNDDYVKLSYNIKNLKQIIVSQTKITQKNNSNINEQNVVFKDNINTRESENDNLQLSIQYSQALYSEAITYFEYYLSKFKEYLNYFTIENIYSYLKNF